MNKPGASFDWNETRIEQLRNLHEKGYSAAKIAEIMDPTGGLSRNAVLGAFHRKIAPTLEGKVNKPKPPPFRKPSGQPALPPAIRRARALASKQRANAKRPKEAFKPPQPRREPPASANSKHMRLEELNDGLCHWPEGNGPFLFCGDAVWSELKPSDSRYCEFHSRLSVSKSQP